VAERSDLLDRCLMVELERIPKTAKSSERRFWEKLDAVKGKVLGALFDAIYYTLCTPSVELAELERMADFNEIGYRLAEGLGFDGETFLQALSSNTEKTVDTALKSSPVAVCLFSLLESEHHFEGSSSELHRKLNGIAYGLRLARSFPQSSAALSRTIRPMITDLRAAGIEVEEWRNKHLNLTGFTIKRLSNIPSHSSQSSQASNGGVSWREDTCEDNANRLFGMSSPSEVNSGAGCEPSEDSEDILALKTFGGVIVEEGGF
jgi:hypothetical protein